MESGGKSAISKPADTSTSLKYNISLLKPYQGEMKPFDLPAQIIPATDPSTLKQGDKLNVTVYVAGKPQADVEITADYINDFGNRVKTDAKGQAELTVRNNGHNVVAALVNHPTPDDAHAPSATQRRHPFLSNRPRKINCHTAKTPRIRGVF